METSSDGAHSAGKPCADSNMSVPNFNLKLDDFNLNEIGGLDGMSSYRILILIQWRGL